jgi:hypothetical protein
MEDTKPAAAAKDNKTPWEVCDETLAVEVRVGAPHVRPHVVPISGKTGRLGREDLVTSFIVVWQPNPPPPPLWIRFLKQAPFGTQLVRAQDLHWDGKYLSVELVNEADIDGYAAQIGNWVEYANATLASCEKSPAVMAQREAEKRAAEIEQRLRRG